MRRCPEDLRAASGPWVFGCDVCSEVCPWARKAPDLAERFGLHAGVAALQEQGAVSLLHGGSVADADEAFRSGLLGSPLRRPGRAAMAGNAAIVLGNQPSENGRVALLTALEGDPSALVREAAAWGLREGHSSDDGTQAALERAAAREPEGPGATAMRRRL